MQVVSCHKTVQDLFLLKKIEFYPCRREMLSVYSTKYLNETGVLFVAFSHLYVQHVVEANRKNSGRII
jgi:hypothetical protein